MNQRQYVRSLAINLIEARKEKGMTQDELAEASGVFQSYICRIEKAKIKRGPPSHILYCIARGLEVSTDSLEKSCLREIRR